MRTYTVLQPLKGILEEASPHNDWGTRLDLNPHGDHVWESSWDSFQEQLEAQRNNPMGDLPVFNPTGKL